MKKEVNVLFYEVQDSDFIKVKNEIVKARKAIKDNVMTKITVEASNRVIRKLICEIDDMLYHFRGVKVSGRDFGPKEGCYFTINNGEVDILLEEVDNYENWKMRRNLY